MLQWKQIELYIHRTEKRIMGDNQLLLITYFLETGQDDIEGTTIVQ